MVLLSFKMTKLRPRAKQNLLEVTQRAVCVDPGPGQSLASGTAAPLMHILVSSFQRARPGAQNQGNLQQCLQRKIGVGEGSS